MCEIWHTSLFHSRIHFHVFGIRRWMFCQPFPLLFISCSIISRHCSMNDWTLDFTCLITQCCFFIPMLPCGLCLYMLFFLLIWHVNKLCQPNDSVLKISWIPFPCIFMNFHLLLLFFHATCLEHPRHGIFYFQITSPKIIVWW